MDQNLPLSVLGVAPDLGAGLPGRFSLPARAKVRRSTLLTPCTSQASPRPASNEQMRS